MPPPQSQAHLSGLAPASVPEGATVKRSLGFPCSMVIRATHAPNFDISIEGFTKLVMKKRQLSLIIFKAHNELFDIVFFQQDCQISISIHQCVGTETSQGPSQGNSSFFTFEIITPQGPQIKPNDWPQPVESSHFATFFDLGNIRWVDRKVTIRGTCMDVRSNCSKNVRRWLRQNISGSGPNIEHGSSRRIRDGRSASPRNRRKLRERSRSPPIRPAREKESRRTECQDGRAGHLHDFPSRERDRELVDRMLGLNIHVPEEDEEWETVSATDEVEHLAWSCEQNLSIS